MFELIIGVCSQGNYNKGKTFVLKLLAGVDLGDGYTHHTRGISMRLVKETEHHPAIVVFDSAGSNTPVKCKHTHTLNTEI
jgi:hypothetical protein